jgi:pimeloyl-ACP methyl ester carboxylesterase
MRILIAFASIFMAAQTLTEFARAESLSLAELRQLHSSRYFGEIKLPSGSTHIQTKGSGPVIILVHGVSGPLAVWDKNIEPLLQAGYRVARYDLFGRGFSERLTDNFYSLDTYEKQLEEIVSTLDVGSPIRLVGSSFGAIIATEYALRHPERVAGLVLIGPAGFPISVPWTAKLKDIPLLGKLLSYFLAYGTILKQNDHYFVSDKMPDDLRPFVADQLSVPGTTNAILSTMENAPVQSYVESYKKLGESKIPVGLIWGRKDATFPFENANVLVNVAPQSQLVTIQESGHLPQYEKADEVNRALLKFLRTFDKNGAAP